MEETDSDLESMPDDEIMSVLNNDNDNDSEELFVADEIVVNNPKMVDDAFEERILDLLSDTLKNILLQLLNDFVKKLMPKFDKRVKKTLKAEHLQTKVENSAFDLHELVNLKEQQFSDEEPLSSYALVIHSAYVEPLAKKLRVVLDYPIPTLTPLNTTSDDDILTQVITYMEEARSTPNLLNLYKLKAVREGPITLEEAKLQMQEVKRLADLKTKKENLRRNLEGC
nr:hypothetical protein [Tanacetum cinerariifolium]